MSLRRGGRHEHTRRRARRRAGWRSVAAAACRWPSRWAPAGTTTKNTQTGDVVGLTDTGGPKVTAGDCAGLKNGTGITDTKITIANASDMSGLVPGLFKDAQQAVQAYVAYFNAGQDICGRKLEYLPLDSRLDAGGDQQAAQQACEKAFAMVGSMAAFDSGGASVVTELRHPGPAGGDADPGAAEVATSRTRRTRSR